MKDKIIQITDTLTSENDGQILGLGESGKLYLLKEQGRFDDVRDPYKKRIWVVTSRTWELLLDSPEKDA